VACLHFFLLKNLLINIKFVFIIYIERGGSFLKAIIVHNKVMLSKLK